MMVFVQKDIRILGNPNSEKQLMEILNIAGASGVTKRVRATTLFGKQVVQLVVDCFIDRDDYETLIESLEKDNGIYTILE